MAEITPIAHIRSDFAEKFGVPRQSGLVPELVARVVFEPEFRGPDWVRGIEGFSHLWLIWQFSHNLAEGYSSTSRPPRLGGNTALGTFATRSPFRPNALGLSSVKLLEVKHGELVVGGADLVDGTPIFDIKPYVATDAHPDAEFGFTKMNQDYQLDVIIPESLISEFEPDTLTALRGILSEDPRPPYQREPERIYGLTFAGRNVRFQVSGKTLSVLKVSPP